MTGFTSNGLTRIRRGTGYRVGSQAGGVLASRNALSPSSGPSSMG